VDDIDDGTYSRAPTLEDVARIGRALNQAEARYVLIGGFAVIIHGSGRTTKDIDFLIDPSPQNVARIKSALSVLSDNAAAELEDGDVEKYQVVRIADEVVVDLLGKACGVLYDDAVSRAERRDIGGEQILVADKQTLIRTKQTIRPADHMDCEYLEWRIAEEDRDLRR
jgi:Nucleotidyl transferase AbiEii toxin, Type IV TA system